jgi:hypothetical protein
VCVCEGGGVDLDVERNNSARILGNSLVLLNLCYTLNFNLYFQGCSFVRHTNQGRMGSLQCEDRGNVLHVKF